MSRATKSGIRRAFGVGEDGEVLLPRKISNVLLAGIERGGLPGWKWSTRNRRSWKDHRKTQYKVR